MEKEDFLKELGYLGFATRLKRLSDQLLHDGRKMYLELGMDIEPNWYVIFRLLQENESMTVTEIADSVGMAHPSVITITNKMMDKEYLLSAKDPSDSRKRVLSLSSKAQKQLPKFEEVWQAGISSVEKAMGDVDALEFLDFLEKAFNQKGFKDRTLDEM
ncbi:MAG: MarR family winged helix-turn-helix transcriptional regulator [Flavobacteriales bacterium]|nr:MarR family winged helix-turn-helix transcriptional regulator [Flavobacteriales bacterium]